MGKKKLPVWVWVLIAIGVLGPVGLVGTAIVASIAIPKLVSARLQANEMRTHEELLCLAQGVDAYVADHGEYPPSLRALGGKSSGGAPYLPAGATLVDLWGRPYSFAQPGEYADCALLYSLGRDGEPGGELDDADLVLEIGE